ncbi:MAG: c-type cytochrome, partial [Chitinophagales bacterium]
MRKSFLSIILMAGIAAMISTACTSGKNDTGRIFMPDMHYSNAYETYSTTDFQYQDETDSVTYGMSAIQPVENTIPYGYLPDDEEVRTNEMLMKSYLMKNYFVNPMKDPELDAEQRALASTAMHNPLMKTPEVLKDGKEIYNIYCAVCHGESGQGDGTLLVRPDGTDGPYTALPPTYESRLPTLTDGDIFYSISYGKNAMGGYYAQVSPEDRWKLVHYIKDMAGIEDENAVPTIDVAAIEIEEGSTFDVPSI